MSATAGRLKAVKRGRSGSEADDGIVELGVHDRGPSKYESESSAFERGEKTASRPLEKRVKSDNGGATADSLGSERLENEPRKKDRS